MSFRYLLIIFSLYLLAITSGSLPEPPHLNVTCHEVSPNTIWTLGSGRTPYESTVTLIIEGSGDPIPLEVVIAIDSSASMENKMNYVKAVAKNLLGTMNPESDKVGFVSWSHYIKSSENLTNNFIKINKSIGNTTPGGGTDFNIALNESISILNNGGENIKKYIIFLSDGVHNTDEPYIRPPNPYSPVVRAVKDGIEIWTIGYTVAPEEEEFLIEMANLTGGEYYSANNNVTLDEAFWDIYRK